MFTGIIACTGQLSDRQPHGEDQTLTITAPDFDFSACNLGDSIAVNGVCLTAVALDTHTFSADVSVETLTHTTLGALALGDRVNLESALTLSTPLGGHLVSGHVDGVGELLSRKQDARSERLTFRAPDALSRYIAAKGSITIDGVSLTVNNVTEHTFSVNIVPHTLARTIIDDYQINTAVNLEVDLLARYIERLLQDKESTPTLSLERLRALGY
ncbi:riboflavin synthase [Suttonella sp. R2A3]|uniref:riboflavin synthase n=1 Tax=Suttonella sp. R2A3 TaxID=2908648 RepID=UPI001F429617|nr:riboflavin synthase [Suttonella sp. R2A3]UJF25379.1 riboflavin synthase [Suttonella sp. R2A3]